MPLPKSSKEIILHGIRWNLATSLIRRVFSIVLLFFLASWLSQDDFGVFRTYSLILLITAILSIFGMDSQFLTNKKHPHLSLFAFQQLGLISSILLALGLALVGPILGEIYQSAQLGQILRFSSIFVIVEIFRRRFRVQAQSLLRFRELALAETWNVVFYSTLSLGLIFFVREVWLYIVLFYLGNAVEAIYLGRVLPKANHITIKRLCSRNWLRRSLALVRRNIGFQGNVSFIQLINNYSGNAPILFLGAIVAPQYMGQYFFASQLIGVPVNMFTASVGQVFYPSFARSETDKTISGINSYSRLALFLGIPALVFYAFALSICIPLVLGSKWDSALPLLYYLIAFFGTSLLNDPVSSIPYICRKPHWELIWNIATLVVRLSVLWLGIRSGFDAAILAFCIASGLMNILFYTMSLILLKAPLIRALLKVGLGMVIAVTMIAAFSILPSTTHAIWWACLIMLTYLGGLFAIDRGLMTELKMVLRGK